ncbi:MAG: hypothetical protein HQ478_07730 [Chloroflexi bacterium]|nr:hypothetical protein [Chloroflexota bacterium]
MAGRMNSELGGAGFNRDSVQSLWREAMVLRELSRNGVSDARARRTEAEDARRHAEQEAMRATEEYCTDLRKQAESDLKTAQESLASAERLKANIEADLDRRSNDAKSEYEMARRAREDADAYSSKVHSDTEDRTAKILRESEERGVEAGAASASESSRIISEAEASAAQIEEEARARVDELIAQANADADGIRDQMQTDTAAEIQALLTDIEIARTSIEEELEAQRILTETARIRATSPGLAARASSYVPESAKFDVIEQPEPVEIVTPVKTQAKKTTTRKAAPRRVKKAA